MFVRGYIAKWLEHWPGNQKVPGLCHLVSLSKKRYSHIVYWLVSTGEAAHPAVTSMGTWCLLGEANVQLSLSHLMVLDCRGTLGSILSTRPGQSSCGFPQEDLPAQGSSV